MSVEHSDLVKGLADELFYRGFRNATIEECARVAESDDYADYLHAGPAIAAAIRALKEP